MAEDGMSIVPYGSNLDVVLYVPVLFPFPRNERAAVDSYELGVTMTR